MKRNRPVSLSQWACLAFAVCTIGASPAQVPQLINHQGRVAVNGANFDGAGQFKFALVNATGTTTYWSNDGTSTDGGEPTAAVSLNVAKGLYSVLLGDATQPHMSMVPGTVFANANVHLRIWFNDGVNGFQLLAPDKRIAAVGYAMMADTVADLAITTAKIADGAVTADKLAPGAVGAAQLANPSLTVAAGTGLSGGGTVALGGTITLANAGVLSLNGGGGIAVDATTGAVTLGSTATSTNTAGAIVARDANGDFSAGTITGDLMGDATNFTGTLAGDVTGTQGSTAIASTIVTGKALTGFVSGAGTIAATDSLLTAINKLDGNVALRAPLASPSFTGSVTLPAGTAAVPPINLQSGTSLTTPVFGAVEFDGTNVFVTNNSGSPTRKTLAFTDSTVSAAQLVDGSITAAKLAPGAVGSTQLASGLTLGGTTSGTFSGTLSGNATTATDFTGSLAGDVTGTQSNTAVVNVGGVTSTNVASGANLANAATDANAGGAIVKRDASGNFSASTVTASFGFALAATTSQSVGVITQADSRLIHTFGSSNFFAGIDAGNFVTTGSGNTAVGRSALKSNTTGFSNTASGSGALLSNTTGTNNTATGTGSLYWNTTGDSNTASGSAALRDNTAGTFNTANGTSALIANTTGSSNTASGGNALQANTIGNFNTANGGSTLHSNLSAGQNVAVGYRALFTQSFDNGGVAWNSRNVAVGYQALAANQPTSTSTGINNTAVGTSALAANTTGANNIALGNNAGNLLTTGSNNIAIGHVGVAGDANIIRIGTPGLHTETHLAGIIHGDGSGITGTKAKVDRQSVGFGGSSNQTYQDVATLTTHNLGESGCYIISMSCVGTTSHVQDGFFILNIGGTDVPSTERRCAGSVGATLVIMHVAHNVAAGTAIKVRCRTSSPGTSVTATNAQLTIDGIPQSSVQ